MYFDKNSRGRMISLLELLLDMSYDDSGRYNDIHIKPEDCGAFSVEWSQESWKYIHDRGGFQYVGADDEICSLFEFPDGHSDYVPVGDEKAYLNDWLEENTGWEKDESGKWRKKNEVDELMRLLGEKPEDNVIKPNTNWETNIMLLNAEQENEPLDLDGRALTAAELEDELRNGIDPKYFEEISLKDIDWATPATTTEAKNLDIDFDRLAEPEYLKTIIEPELGFTEPYKYSVDDD